MKIALNIVKEAVYELDEKDKSKLILSKLKFGKKENFVLMNDSYRKLDERDDIPILKIKYK